MTMAEGLKMAAQSYSMDIFKLSCCGRTGEERRAPAFEMSSPYDRHGFRLRLPPEARIGQTGHQPQFFPHGISLQKEHASCPSRL